MEQSQTNFKSVVCAPHKAESDKVSVQHTDEGLQARAENPSLRSGMHKEKNQAGNSLVNFSFLFQDSIPISLRISVYAGLVFALSIVIGLYAVPQVYSATRELQPVATKDSLSIDLKPVTDKGASAKPAKDHYKDRNFSSSKKSNSEVSPKITVARKPIHANDELGLRLVGTVVFDKSGMNQALFESLTTHKQGIFREGSRIGEIQIKKILRDKVIIVTAEGERLLNVGHGRASRVSNPSPPAQRETGARPSQSPQRVTERWIPGKSYSLAHDEVVASLANIQELEQRLDITPNLIDDEPLGFVISRIPQQSILRKMGLKNNNAIVEVNGQAITGPEQADLFFQTLRQGGEVDVKVKKGRGVRRRTRIIHMNIN